MLELRNASEKLQSESQVLVHRFLFVYSDYLEKISFLLTDENLTDEVVSKQLTVCNSQISFKWNFPSTQKQS